MDEDLFIQYLADYGVEIPDNLEVTVVQDIIADLEVEPDKSAPIVGWTEYADFFEELRNVVKEYNNLNPWKGIETNNKLTSVNWSEFEEKYIKIVTLLLPQTLKRVTKTYNKKIDKFLETLYLQGMTREIIKR